MAKKVKHKYIYSEIKSMLFEDLRFNISNADLYVAIKSIIPDEIKGSDTFIGEFCSICSQPMYSYLPSGAKYLNIDKSSRHSKIAGDFGKHLLCHNLRESYLKLSSAF